MPKTSPFHIVLLAPEIPGNTGSIGRTCLALNAHLHLIKPYGFDLSEKAVRRAGLDYWKFVPISEYESWDHFWEKNSKQRFYFLSRFAQKNLYQQKLPIDQECFFVFGSETKGLPDFIHEEFKESLFSLPILSSHVRSLNLSNAVCAVAYEAYRQLSAGDKLS